MQKYHNLQIHIIPIYKDNYIFVARCLNSGVVFCVDPGDFAPIDQFLANKGWKLDYIINTHHHWDHITGNLALKEKYHCQIIGNKHDAKRIDGIDIEVEEGSVIKLGEVELQVLEISGHTIGHIAYFIAKDAILFCGDTIFSSGCGYLFEGSPAQMHQSLAKLKKLPKETVIYCAHEYTLNNIAFALSLEPNNQHLKDKLHQCQKLREQNIPTIPTNLEIELLTNPFLRADSPEIRQNLSMLNNSDEEVFAQIRKLKNGW